MKFSDKNGVRTASLEWLNILAQVHTNGYDSSPRGMETQELIGVSSRFEMSNPIVSIKSRKLSYRFMAAEAFWILSGSNKVEHIAPYNPRMADYSDDGITLAGAYGPRVFNQIAYVASKLLQDPMTRQAVMTTWKANPLPSKDIPCTLTTQFIIRENRLHVIHTMRSNDIWWGYPYDVFSFTMIAAFICIWLREQGMPTLDLGVFIMNAGSQHLYMKHEGEAVKVLQNPGRFSYRPLILKDFETTDDLLDHLNLLRDGKFSETRSPFFIETEPYYAKPKSTAQVSG